MPDILETDFTDRVILCVPKFAWRVARSFLSQQGQWKSTYSMEHHNEWYETPDETEFDQIRASVDEFLAGDDMSCDIVAALEELTGYVAAIADKDCPTPCPPALTQGGSGGSGYSEDGPVDYTDDGTNPPNPFEEYSLYDAYKCQVAKLIVQQLEADLEYLKNLAVTEITATVIGFVLMTPIPFDDIAVLVGVLVTWALEEVLDDIIDAILAELGVSSDDLICALYLAVDAPDAVRAMDDWASDNLSNLGAWLVSFFSNNNNANRLFTQVNALLPANDCQSCTEPEQEEGYWDFRISEWDWDTLEDSTNPVWVDGTGFKGSRSGVGSAIMSIASPVAVSSWGIETAIYGSGGQMTIIRIYASSDLETWVQRGYKEFFSTPPGVLTWARFDNVALDNEYIRIRVERFANGSSAYIQLARLVSDPGVIENFYFRKAGTIACNAVDIVATVSESCTITGNIGGRMITSKECIPGDNDIVVVSNIPCEGGTWQVLANGGSAGVLEGTYE